MSHTFGQRLIALRVKRSLSQIALSRLAHIPASTLNYLERDIRSGEKLALGTARRLATALGVTIDYLAGVYDESLVDTACSPAYVIRHTVCHGGPAGALIPSDT